MSTDHAQQAPQRELGPAVALFQKAHQKIAMLARLDEQLAQILSRRRSLQVELRNVQAEINEEFDRLIEVAADEEAPTRESGRVGRLADETPEATRRNGFAEDTLDATVAVD